MPKQTIYTFQRLNVQIDMYFQCATLYYITGTIYYINTK